MIPATDTEFGKLHARANYPQTLLFTSEFFKNYEPQQSGDMTYDFNDFITREFKLYENYIVFKQTSPFLNVSGFAVHDSSLAYNSFLNADCSITQEAYYNVKTGEIELIKVYGNTMWHSPGYLGKMVEINMEIYIHDIDEMEYTKKIDSLCDYVQTNADK